MDVSQSPNSSSVEDEFHQSTLYSAPSFEIYNNRSHGDDDGDDPEEVLKRTALMTLQSLEARGSGGGEFSFDQRRKMDSIEEGENESDWSTGIQNLSVEEEEEGVGVGPPSPPMYLATGLGVGDEVVVSDNRTITTGDDILFAHNLQESGDLEEYYKRMVDEYPSHPLVLKKYAQLLQVSSFLSYFQLIIDSNGTVILDMKCH